MGREPHGGHIKSWIMIGAAENMHKFEIVLDSRRDVVQSQQVAQKFRPASHLKKWLSQRIWQVENGETKLGLFREIQPIGGNHNCTDTMNNINVRVKFWLMFTVVDAANNQHLSWLGEAGKGPVHWEVKLCPMNKSFWTVKTLKAFKGDSKKLNLETGSTYVPHPGCISSAAASQLTFSSSLYVSRACCDQTLMKVRCLTTPYCGPETSVKGYSPCLGDSPFIPTNWALFQFQPELESEYNQIKKSSRSLSMWGHVVVI